MRAACALVLAVALSGAATGAAYLLTTEGETYKCDSAITKDYTTSGKESTKNFCDHYCTE
jgi:hypothetical protein